MRPPMRAWTLMLSLGVLITLSAQAPAQICEDPEEVQEALQYLRRLTLDLRGRVPTVEEMQAVIDTGEVSETTIDEMLESDDFLHQLTEFHRDLLWANISNVRLTNNTFVLNTQRIGDSNILALANPGRATRWRGAAVPCLDEPARFDDEGNILTTESPNPQNPNQTIRQEGWVEVAPFWNPNQPVRVCAFDAQENLTGTVNGRRQVNCAASAQSLECGCGPNLQFCHTRATINTVVDALNTQMLRTAERVVAQDRPYTDLLLSRDIEVNGPVAHYFRYQSLTATNILAASPDSGYELPQQPYTDATWTTVEGDEAHSGVLTLPGFLLRFQSNRGRANQFYNAFLCQPFQAPEGGLPASDDPCNSEPDLVFRCGCNYCHGTLEPASAHWGRWSEAGLMPLRPETFPRYNPDCDDPQLAARNPLCNRFYLVEANHEKEEAYTGQLLSYVFADDHAEREGNIEEGPRKLAEAAVNGGFFGRCMAERQWTTVMGRAPTDAEDEILDDLASTFAGEGYNFKALVKALVTRPEYVAAGRFGEVD
ncbi:MAG: DUF1549 domain-containing protein [Bradymonadia bacterium]